MPGARLTDSTVRTLLRRLEAKGYAAHRREGKRFLYRALLERRHAAADAVHRVLEGMLKGAADALLLGMVERGLIDRRELARVDSALAELEASRGGRDDEDEPRRSRARKPTDVRRG
jgi:predicted transcriptional regulator